MLGEALKQLRLFYGVKQKDLALKLNVSQSYLSEIESGVKENIPVDLLYKYGEVFDIEPSYLLMFSDELRKKSGNLRLNKSAARKVLKIMDWISEKRDFGDEAT